MRTNTIALCTLALVAATLFATPATAGSSTSVPECQFCSAIVGLVEAILSNNQTDYSILYDLESECALLSSSDMQQECVTFLETYGPVVISILEGGLPASIVCDTIDFCGSNILPPCGLCEQIVADIELYGGNNASDQEVLQDILGFCKDLPSADQQACVDEVNKIGPAIIAWVLSDESPDAACATAGFCNGTDQGCDACEFVVSELEDYDIGSTSTVDNEILSKLLAGCADFPTSSEQSKCTTDLNTYGPVIIQGLKNGTPADTVCTDLKICTSSF